MKKYEFEDERSFMRFVKIYLVIAAMVYACLAFTCVVKGETQNACGSAQLSAQEYGDQYLAAFDDALEAMTSAPEGWDFCTMPSFYTRSCESCPMSVRWASQEGCPTIAVCGNHAKPCTGIDGGQYIIKGQTVNGQFDRYPIPNIAGGNVPRDKWTQCYIDHDVGMGCATAVPLPGVQTYIYKTLAQVPPGPQRDAWCNLWHCPGCDTTPTPVPTAGPTPPPGVNPYAAWIEAFFADGITGGCATSPLRYCPKDTVTREQLAIIIEKVLHGSAFVPPPCVGVFADVGCANSSPLTITIGPMPTKTITPHFSTAPTKTPTPHIGN